MTKKEYLLTCLAEECIEVAKEVHKALRFGLDDTNPATKQTNAEAIKNELTDIVAVLEELKRVGVLLAPYSKDSEYYKNKVRRIIEWANYSNKKEILE